MVKCSIHGCQQLDQKGSKSQCYSLPKVKPLNERESAKAREGKLRAVISNKQRTAWLNVIKKGYTKNESRAKDDGNNSAYTCMQIKASKRIKCQFYLFSKLSIN